MSNLPTILCLYICSVCSIHHNEGHIKITICLIYTKLKYRSEQQYYYCYYYYWKIDRDKPFCCDVWHFIHASLLILTNHVGIAFAGLAWKVYRRFFFGKKQNEKFSVNAMKLNWVIQRKLQGEHVNEWLNKNSRLLIRNKRPRLSIVSVVLRFEHDTFPYRQGKITEDECHQFFIKLFFSFSFCHSLC